MKKTTIALAGCPSFKLGAGCYVPHGVSGQCQMVTARHVDKRAGLLAGMSKKRASRPFCSFEIVIAAIAAVEPSFAHQFHFAVFEQDFVALAAAVRASVRFFDQFQFLLAENRVL